MPIPFAYEGPPRLGTSSCSPQGKLRGAKARWFCLAFQQMIVELGHDSPRLMVRYLPETHDDAPRAGNGEGATEAEHTFAAENIPDARFTRREDDQFRIDEIQCR